MRRRRRALWSDFSSVVDAAAADGSLSEHEASELRRLAYAGAPCLTAVYAAQGGAPPPGVAGEARDAFLACARRALEAAAADSEGAAHADATPLPVPTAAVGGGGVSGSGPAPAPAAIAAA